MSTGARASLLAAVLVGVLVAILAVGGTDGEPLSTRGEGTPRPPSTSTTVSTTITTTTAAPPAVTTATTLTTTTASPPVPAPIAPGAAAATVDRLVVAEPDPGLAPYRRDHFGDDWDYDPATGCNTREWVLIEESHDPVEVDDRCRPLTGRWTSLYDGVTTSDPADLQIDHLVPLAEAWRTGAAAWSPERRMAFHSDLTNPNSLVAVTGSTNASKGDRPPDRWLPPDPSAHCAYAVAWVDVKAQWELSVSPAEKATLVQLLQGC